MRHALDVGAASKLDWVESATGTASLTGFYDYQPRKIPLVEVIR